MATKVVMEALSPTMEEGRLVSWKKQEGDAVKNGELLAEVETDKAVMDLVARADGVLRKRLVTEGTTVPVSATVAIIGTKDEDISGLVGEQKPAPQKPAAPAAPPADAGARPEAGTKAPALSAPPARAVAEPALQRGEHCVTPHPAAAVLIIPSAERTVK